MLEQNMDIDRRGPEASDAEASDTICIQELSNTLRQTSTGGRIVMAAGVGALPDRVSEQDGRPNREFNMEQRLRSASGARVGAHGSWCACEA